jgi:hypothetical protein
MEAARECFRQVRRFLPLEYTVQLLLSVSGLFAWGPNKGRLSNGVRKLWRELENAVLK